MNPTPPNPSGVSGEKSPDWEAIERDFRAGVLSLREIARQHGISEGAIRKRAKANGWQRDLTDRVRKATNAVLVRDQVRTPDARTADARTEKETVEDAAAVCVALVREHRADLRGLRQTAEVLMGQLQVCADNRDLLQDLIAEETADDKTSQRRAALMKAVSLSAHAGVLRDLSVVLKNAIPLERQALNIDALPPPAPPEKAMSIDLERVQRLESKFARYRAPVTIEQ